MTSRTVVILLVGALTVSGCARISESRLNPFNWFGGSEEQRVETVEVVRDPRPLVDQVTSLAIERTPTGAIIRAVGLPPTQGWYDAALVSDTDGPVDGVLSYRFRAFPPVERTRVSTRQSRELSVARSISTTELAATSAIRVIGARNVLTTRR